MPGELGDKRDIAGSQVLVGSVAGVGRVRRRPGLPRPQSDQARWPRLRVRHPIYGDMGIRNYKLNYMLFYLFQDFSVKEHDGFCRERESESRPCAVQQTSSKSSSDDVWTKIGYGMGVPHLHSPIYWDIAMSIAQVFFLSLITGAVTGLYRCRQTIKTWVGFSSLPLGP